MKGYPPSALSLIPRLVERAGVDLRSGGSITAIYTVLADGDDTDDPIVDATRAIVDGHIVLSRHLSEQAIFPAIDIGKSLSRVMSDIVDDEHLASAAMYRALWAAYEENRDLILMGAYRPGNDPLIDEAVARRQEVLDFLRQDPRKQIDMDSSIAALVAEFSL
jgi:flagellum-specific ATP synthase